jgi:hypothetical protein
MLYRKHPERIHGILFLFFLPSASAVRYIVPVLIPAIPAIMERLPTLMTNCKKPIPEAPIRPERYT